MQIALCDLHNMILYEDKIIVIVPSNSLMAKDIIIHSTYHIFTIFRFIPRIK